ncbi:Phosphoglycolate phosphatase, putative [Perkinsus marinus ATCC 50983]|uniref:Phosphoglycolate phosphatase, putative n=1 Tax=Perkinsus marinus (strain ATCC 50983 / TXsc) TaxID=423536 RepID=C5K7P7_PERM5|nr:Phosphoglycolate phosphatase, putative [Perkinsus marinus ATCC 50983]EER19582.1 Phosphoglycolate phosphatase, putative [Perkinsus marinus ATCC 50983]|eukprot:XP_002787786.1 Phosphoglycolate phosphatase, putative [Perkinsus marinus ATCC 50983]
MSTAEDARILVTFDVDGTLVRSVGSTGAERNRWHHLAFAAGMKEVFNIDDADVTKIAHHGLTDMLIARDLAVHYGCPPVEVTDDKVARVMKVMDEFAREHYDKFGEGLEILPGVRSLLKTLSEEYRCKVVVGLVTGNVESIGWAKMRALGIEQYFTTEPIRVGAFGGNDSPYRAELVRMARSKAETVFPGIKRHFHVGDAPNDIMAAIDGGAFAIGVTTGTFSADDLNTVKGATAENHIVLESLLDNDRVLAVMGLCR